MGVIGVMELCGYMVLILGDVVIGIIILFDM